MATVTFHECCQVQNSWLYSICENSAKKTLPHRLREMLASANALTGNVKNLRRVRLGYSGIRIYSGIYSGYSAPGSRIAGMEIQVFRNENSSQTNAYSHYSNYSYSGLIPNERALNLLEI